MNILRLLSRAPLFTTLRQLFYNSLMWGCRGGEGRGGEGRGGEGRSPNISGTAHLR